MDQRSETSDTLGKLQPVDIRPNPQTQFHRPTNSTSTARTARTAKTTTTSRSKPSALRPTLSNASTSYSRGAQSADAPGMPIRKPQPVAGILWSDKISVDKAPDNKTFFNDDSPPGSPIEGGFRDDASHALSTGGMATGGMETGGLGYHVKPTRKLDSTYDYQYDYVAPPAPLPEKTIWGMRPRNFYILLGLVLFVIVAIAVGVGVGVGLTSGSDDDDSSDHSDDAHATPTTTSISTTTTVSTVSNIVPTATSTSVIPITTSMACPSANNTLVEVPKSDKIFLRLCGIDYPGDAGGEDLATVFTASMTDCITNCAGFPRCEACSWGALEGDDGDNHRCYLKRNLKKSKAARAGWDFAILQ